MGLKTKNIWKIFSSIALSASIAATNTFAVIDISNDNVDKAKLRNEHMRANSPISCETYLIKIFSDPFVIGKKVYNNYNRNDNEFDFIRLVTADANDVGHTMTRAHSAVRSCAFLRHIYAAPDGAQRPADMNSFKYPIGGGSEHYLIDALMRTLYTPHHTLQTSPPGVSTKYAHLLRLIHTTMTHLWFLRSPSCYTESSTIYLHIYPHFAKVGTDFTRFAYPILSNNYRNSVTPRRVFNSIDAPNTSLRENIITALTIAECAPKIESFSAAHNSLDASEATQRMYDMLNETLYALLVYGLACLDEHGDPLATYASYTRSLVTSPKAPPEYNPLLTPDVTLASLSTKLRNAIDAVRNRYTLSEGLQSVIADRCDNVSTRTAVDNEMIAPAEIFIRPKPFPLPPPQSPQPGPSTLPTPAPVAATLPPPTSFVHPSCNIPSSSEPLAPSKSVRKRRPHRLYAKPSRKHPCVQSPGYLNPTNPTTTTLTTMGHPTPCPPIAYYTDPPAPDLNRWLPSTCFVPPAPPPDLRPCIPPLAILNTVNPPPPPSTTIDHPNPCPPIDYYADPSATDLNRWLPSTCFAPPAPPPDLRPCMPPLAILNTENPPPPPSTTIDHSNPYPPIDYYTDPSDPAFYWPS